MVLTDHQPDKILLEKSYRINVPTGWMIQVLFVEYERSLTVTHINDHYVVYLVQSCYNFQRKVITKDPNTLDHTASYTHDVWFVESSSWCTIVGTW